MELTYAKDNEKPQRLVFLAGLFVIFNCALTVLMGLVYLFSLEEWVGFSLAACGGLGTIAIPFTKSYSPWVKSCAISILSLNCIAYIIVGFPFSYPPMTGVFRGLWVVSALGIIALIIYLKLEKEVKYE